jgi:formamidopyrimidine-DNA glycosylase
MPELPEVETVCRGIAPHVLGQRVIDVKVREPRLRWPVQACLAHEMSGQHIETVERRGKYLLLKTAAGSVILHLGMSGSLRVLPIEQPAGKHDHVDIVFAAGRCLRLSDPRRFGCLIWTRADPLRHPLLAELGPEPLDDSFDGEYLFRMSRGRKAAIKTLLMNSRIVAGIGNIYASESLFYAGIHPRRAAGRISRERYARLAEAIKHVLKAAIEQGGTTLRDFVRDDGRPGYFRASLAVYGRAGEPCRRCGIAIIQSIIGQRSTYYCGRCQH